LEGAGGGHIFYHVGKIPKVKLILVYTYHNVEFAIFRNGTGYPVMKDRSMIAIVVFAIDVAAHQLTLILGHGCAFGANLGAVIIEDILYDTGSDCGSPIHP
jgi:hypothetical protein